MGNISGWTEGILFTILFVSVLGLAFVGLNQMYDKDHSLGITDNSTESLFLEYADNSQSNIQGGEVDFDSSQGLTLKTSWNMAKDAGSLVWTFVSGGFIENVAKMLNAGPAGLLLAKTLRVLFFLSVIFGLLYALFKVVL